MALLSAAATFIAAHPLCLAAAFAAVLLIWLDLRMRMKVWHIRGPTEGLNFVLGNLLSIVRMAGDGKLTDYCHMQFNANGWKTYAAFNPGFAEIMICSPENMRHMFSTKFSNYVLPRVRCECFEEVLGQGIFNSNGAQWKEQRSTASHLFSAQQLRDRMTTVFTRHARKVHDMLSAGAGDALDLQKLMYSYTFDSICEIAFGHPVDSLGGNPKDVEFQRCFDRVQLRSIARFKEPFVWKVKRALNVGAEREFRDDLRVVREYLSALLKERGCASPSGGSPDGSPKSPVHRATEPDLVSFYLEQCAEQGRRPTQEELRDLVMNFILAGRDTTACVSTWAFWELARRPAAREKVVAEVRQLSDLAQMQYTQAVFQEVLRLHPSVPFDGKECLRDDVLPDGTRVPRGCLLQFSPAGITRNPALYPDPDEFRPERWMGDDGVCRRYDEYEYPVFNAGPRICLGRHMAALEAKVIMAELLSDLRIDIVDGFTPKLLHHVVLMTQNGMMVKASRAAAD